MKRILILVVSLLMIMSLFLAACAPEAVPAPAPVARVPALPAAPAASVKPAWQEEWDNTLWAAMQEGQLSLAITAGGEARTGLSVALKDKYRITVQSASGTGGALVPKVLAERRAGLYLWDVLITAPSRMLSLVKPGRASSPMEPGLILPDLTDPEVIKKVWFDGKLPWTDRDRHIMGPLLAVSKYMVVNTNLVKPGEIKSWDDLLNPKWKGKILFVDPTDPGVGGASGVMPQLYEIKGEDWLRKLAAQEPVLYRDDRLAVDWVAHGKYPIVVGAGTDVTVEFIKAGAPVTEPATQDVEALGAGATAVTLMDRAPHLNAAKVFINYYLSKDGLTIMSKARQSQTARLDVPTDFLPPGSIRQPGVKYWVKDTEEVLLKADVFYAKSKQIFGHLVK